MMKQLIGLLLSTLLVLPGICQAEDEKSGQGQSRRMPEVVVTGTRTEQQIDKLPANVSVITREDIEKSSAKSVPGLLRYEEGIVVRDWTGVGKQVNVDMRGFGETGSYNTLVLVDGRRVNGIDLSGVDWSQIPLSQVERIEIVRGTGTVLYGDNATGGVINIITRTPPEGFKASADITIGSYDYINGTATVGGGGDNIRGSLSVSFQDTDGYRDNNAFRAGDIGGKIVYDASDFMAFELSGSSHNDDYELPGALTEAQLEENRRQSKDQYLDDGKTVDQYLNLRTDLDLISFGGIEMDLSYRTTDSELNDRSAWGMFTQKTDKNTWAFTPRYLWDGRIFNKNNTIVSGIDFYFSEYNVKNFWGPPTALTGTAKNDRNSIGLYFNDELYLLKKLIFTFGARYEQVEYDLIQDDTSSGSLSETVSENEYAFNTGLTYLYHKGSSVFMRINRSFRFPLVDEMVETVEVAPWTYQLQLNSDLKPQTGMHYEAGIRHIFSSKFMGNITFFQANIEDEILLDKVTFPPFGENVNHPGTLHQGVELGAKVKPLKNISIHGNYTYENATFEKEPHKGNDIPAVPNHKANIGMSIIDVMPAFTFIADYNHIGSSYAVSDMANQYNKLKAYYTIDVKLTYKYKRLNAYAGIKNLTDQKYSEYAIIGGSPTGVNYYPMPERNFFAGVEFLF